MTPELRQELIRDMNRRFQYEAEALVGVVTLAGTEDRIERHGEWFLLYIDELGKYHPNQLDGLSPYCFGDLLDALETYYIEYRGGKESDNYSRAWKEVPVPKGEVQE